MKLFIIPGAPKSGTTSFINSIVKNNKLYIKETSFLIKNVSTNFLKKRSVSSFKDYLKYSSINSNIYIDGSMTYFTEDLSPQKISLIKKEFSDIEILIILRNPFDRIMSAYRMDISNGWVSKEIEEILEDELNGVFYEYGNGPRYIAESLYYKNISRLINSFQITPKLLFFEDVLNYNYSNLDLDFKKRTNYRSNKSSNYMPGKFAKLVKNSLPISFRRKFKDSKIKESLKPYIYKKYNSKPQFFLTEASDLIKKDIKKLIALFPNYEKKINEWL